MEPARQFIYIDGQSVIIQGDTKKRELLKNPTKIEEIQEKNLLTEIEPLQLTFQETVIQLSMFENYVL